MTAKALDVKLQEHAQNLKDISLHVVGQGPEKILTEGGVKAKENE